MKKKIIGMVFIVCVLASFVPWVHAASIIDSGTCGDNLTWTLDSDYTLTISGYGDMYEYSYEYRKIDDGYGSYTCSPYRDDVRYAQYRETPWWTYQWDVKKIIVDEGVTSLAPVAFYNFTAVTSISIPHSMINIGSSAFENCSSLQKIYIPENVTAYDKKYSSSISNFSGCSSLESIEVDENNSTFTSVDGVLFSKDMTELYKYPPEKKDKSYSIPDGVTSIGSFADCKYLENINIPYGVRWIGRFNNCISLKRVEIPGTVHDLDYKFRECTSLECVIINEGVEYIGYVGSGIGKSFAGCTSLKYVVMPKSLIGVYEDDFEDCPALTDVYYSGTDDDYIKLTSKGVRILNDEGDYAFGSERFNLGSERFNLFNDNVRIHCNVTASDFLNKVNVSVNDKDIELENFAFVSNDRTLVPLRSIAEMLGAEVDWNGEDRSIQISKDSDNVKMQIDMCEMYKNDNMIWLDAPPVIKNDVTYVPLRAISEAVGVSVGWDESSRTVTLTQ